MCQSITRFRLHVDGTKLVRTADRCTGRRIAPRRQIRLTPVMAERTETRLVGYQSGRLAPVRSLRLAGASEIRAISGKPPQRLTGWLLLRAGLGAMIPRSSTFTTHTRPTAGFFWGTTPFQLGTESILQALLMALLLFLLLFLIMWPLLVFLLLLLL